MTLKLKMLKEHNEKNQLGAMGLPAAECGFGVSIKDPVMMLGVSPLDSDFAVEHDALSGRRLSRGDAYFSADIETDGPIPGPFSILSFALVYAGSFDGSRFTRPEQYDKVFYEELRPISDEFEEEALTINGLDRNRLLKEGRDPRSAMTNAADWVMKITGNARPVLVAYPLSFDWTWLYWYFVRFSELGSPFAHSRCFDIKTAFAVKKRIPISDAGRSKIPDFLRSNRPHTHHAMDDAIEQAEVFANIFEWRGVDVGNK